MGAEIDVSKFTIRGALEVAKRIVEYSKSPDARARPIWKVEGKGEFTDNEIVPLVHGDEFCDVLLTAIRGARSYILMTAWALTPSFELQRRAGATPAGNLSSESIIGALYEAMRKHRVEVRVLIWRNLLTLVSRTTNMSPSALRAKDVPTRVAPDKPALHQKTVVVDGRIALCGGIDPTDLGGDRWDTEEHRFPDPRRTQPFHDAGPWHDVQVYVEGPAVIEIQQNFVERWKEGAPHTKETALPPLDWSGRRAGGSSAKAQVVRTLPRRESWSDLFMSGGDDSDPFGGGPPRDTGRARGDAEDYSTLESYGRAIVNANRFIYIENQYFTCTFLVDLMKKQLGSSKELAVVVVIPRESELHVPRDAPEKKKRAIAFFQTFVGEKIDVVKVVDELRKEAPERVFVAYRTNAAGQPVYVHAKLIIVDDVFALVGSANLSYRSMFRTDQELGVAWVDTPDKSVAQLRRRLWSEHLELDVDAIAEREKGSKTMAALWRARAAEKEWAHKLIHEWSIPEEGKKK